MIVGSLYRGEARFKPVTWGGLAGPAGGLRPTPGPLGAGAVGIFYIPAGSGAVAGPGRSLGNPIKQIKTERCARHTLVGTAGALSTARQLGNHRASPSRLTGNLERKWQMKAFNASVLGAAVAMALAGPAQAADTNVGGVVWDPDHPTDFDADIAFTQWFTSTDVMRDGTPNFSDVIDPESATPGSFLTGTGEVDLMNSKGINQASPTGGRPISFCPSCELTFAFGGIELDSIDQSTSDDQSTSEPTFDVTDAWLDIYVDGNLGSSADSYNNSYVTITDANEGDGGQDEVDEATDGTKWLELGYDAFSFTEGNIVGGLTEAFFSTEGGIAEGNFDTNFYMGPPTHDLESSQDAYFAGGGNDQYANGTGDLTGDSISIPEPGTLALLGLGLGLAGLGASVRRSHKA